MITISKEQLVQVEYLIEQSAQGNHILFDPDLVRTVFLNSKSQMNSAQKSEVENHMEQVLGLESLEQRHQYLKSLEKDVLHHLVKTYFNIVENNLYESQALRH